MQPARGRAPDGLIWAGAADPRRHAGWTAKVCYLEASNAAATTGMGALPSGRSTSQTGRERSVRSGARGCGKRTPALFGSERSIVITPSIRSGKSGIAFDDVYDESKSVSC